MRLMLAMAFALGVCGAAEMVRLHPVGSSLTVEIEIPGIEGRISTTMPEVVNDSAHRFAYTDTNLRTVEWKKLAGGAITSSWSEPGNTGYNITVTPGADGARIVWRVTNLSPREWLGANGDVCMRLQGVPALFNPTVDRTFLRKDRKWVSVASATPGTGNFWFLPPGEEVLELMKPNLGPTGWRIAELRPDEGIVGIQSRDGQWVVGQAWARSRYLISNTSPRYQCLEAPPLFGDIAAGGSVEATGKIYVIRGGLKDLEKHYQRDLKQGHIAMKRP